MKSSVETKAIDTSNNGNKISPRIAAALDRIDAKVAARHLLTHPFYQAWTRGELTKESLRDYAKQYYQHVAAFPTYLSAVHAHTEDQNVRRELLKNLMDEEAGSPNHPELWLDFAESLGATAEETKNTSCWGETSKLIETFRKICKDGSVAEGVAALYTYESQIPAVSESKIEGLRRFYGFTTPNDYHYFTVHIEADKEHSASERAMLAELLENADLEAVESAVDETLDALWDLLSGVCIRHNITCEMQQPTQ